MSRVLGKRLIAIGDSTKDEFIRQIGERVLRCATNRTGARCDLALVCPYCRVRASKKRRKREDARLSAADPSIEIGMLTLTCPCSDLRLGLSSLVADFRELRSRRLFAKAVMGGVAQIEIELTRSGSLAWLVHIHALVYLHPRERFPTRRLRAGWMAIKRGEPTQLHWKRFRSRWSNEAETFSGATFYTLKRRRPAKELADEQLVELVHALRGQRTVIAFGSRPR
jgi:hypothetical protein